jgi:hypothetical protein
MPKTLTTLALTVVLVLAHLPGKADAPLMCGLIPLERRRSFKGLPVRVLSLWRHSIRGTRVPFRRRFLAMGHDRC